MELLTLFLYLTDKGIAGQHKTPFSGLRLKHISLQEMTENDWCSPTTAAKTLDLLYANGTTPYMCAHAERLEYI